MGEDDQMAVLCILSHGCNGFIYGYDGSVIAEEKITSYLGSDRCPAMKEKPKLVIMNTDQTGYDETEHDKSFNGGRSGERLVARTFKLSDIVVCYPTVKGKWI